VPLDPLESSTSSWASLLSSTKVDMIDVSEQMSITDIYAFTTPIGTETYILKVLRGEMYMDLSCQMPAGPHHGER
jgi:hypothetical protein